MRVAPLVRPLPIHCWLLFCLILTSSEFAPRARADPSPLAGPLASALQPLVEKHDLTGTVVCVANKDRVLDLEAVGYSSLEKHAPMKNDSLFWIASMTKSFTSTALMMLVDEGKINVQDPVEKYLPEFKGQSVAGENGAPARLPKHPITIKEILSHTSGVLLPNDPVLKQVTNLKDEVAKIGAAPLRREPGTKYEYNNCGINTAGRIIEVVSGVPYAEFIQQRLLTPLGMKSTTFWPTEDEARRLVKSSRHAADGQSLEEVKFEANLNAETIERLQQTSRIPLAMISDFGPGKASDYQNLYAMPAGGLYSTAADIVRFCQMLLNGGTFEGYHYLTSTALAEMSANQTQEVPVSPSEAYGLGWSVLTKAEDGLPAGTFGHRGARRTAMWIDNQDQLALVILIARMDMTDKEQREAYGSFLRAAVEKFGAHHE